jgi:hypothetical protein
MKSFILILFTVFLSSILSGCSEEDGSFTGPSTEVEEGHLIYADLGTTFEISLDGAEYIEDWKIFHMFNEDAVELLEYNIEYIGSSDPYIDIEYKTIQTWRYLAKKIGTVVIVFGRSSCENHYRRIIRIKIKSPS